MMNKTERDLFNNEKKIKKKKIQYFSHWSQVMLM